MSKKFKLTIIVETTTDFDQEDFIVRESDIIDGFDLTRTEYKSCITDEFFLTNAYIENIEKIET